MLSRLVITFFPSSKCLLISWLQSPSAVILEPPKIKSATVSTVSPSIFHEVMVPVELFQILKDDAVKVLHSICQPIWKTQQWPQDWKRSVFILISKKGNAKECSNYCTIALISHTSKVMLKILQARLKQYMNHEFPDVQAGFRKGRGTEIKWPIFTGSSKKQESSRKTSISVLLIMPKPLFMWITINCGKFFKIWEYQTT